MLNLRKWIVGVGLATPLLVGGCVEQTMKLDSDPPGALVYLNQQEIGRTPLTRDFKWYGDYDVTLRLEGYETLKTHQKVIAPAWNWVPLDLLAELWPFPVRDQRYFSYKLSPLDPAKDEASGLLQRADYLKGKLESSEFTRTPTTRKSATTRSTTGPSTETAKP